MHVSVRSLFRKSHRRVGAEIQDDEGQKESASNQSQQLPNSRIDQEHQSDTEHLSAFPSNHHTQLSHHTFASSHHPISLNHTSPAPHNSTSSTELFRLASVGIYEEARILELLGDLAADTASISHNSSPSETPSTPALQVPLLNMPPNASSPLLGDTQKRTSPRMHDANVTDSLADKAINDASPVPRKPLHKRIPSLGYIIRVSALPMLALISFSLLTFSNALNWLTYAPVSQLTISTYHLTSDMQLNMLSLIYMFLYPVGAPIANVICVLTSAGTGLMIGASLNLIGSLLRYLSFFLVAQSAGEGINSAYVMLISGQTLCSLSQCFIIGVPPLIANRYFAPKLRPLVTAIGVLMNCAGIGTAFLVSPLARRIGLGQYQLIWAVLAGAAMVFIMVFFVITTDWLFLWKVYHARRQRSRSHEEDGSAETESGAADADSSIATGAFTTDAPADSIAATRASNPSRSRKILIYIATNLLNVVRPLVNIHFLLLTFCFGVAMGSVWAIATMIDQLILPLGYDENDTAALGVANVLCGVLGIFVSGLLGTLLGHLRSLLKVFYILSALSMVFFAYCLQPGMRIWLIFSQVFLGFTTSGVIPLSLELAAETIFPVDEAIGANHQMVAGNAVAICLIFVMSSLNSNGRGVLSVWILAILCCVACIASFFYIGRYKRRAHERRILGEVAVNDKMDTAEQQVVHDIVSV